MKGWKLALAIVASVALGGSIVFLWFLFQFVGAFLN